MSSQEVSTNNRGEGDVPQPNELMVDEEGSQNISEAVEEPPAKTSKIVEEALKNFEYRCHKIRKIVLRKH